MQVSKTFSGGAFSYRPLYYREYPPPGGGKGFFPRVIRAHESKTLKDPGHSSKMTPSCKWPIGVMKLTFSGINMQVRKTFSQEHQAYMFQLVTEVN